MRSAPRPTEGSRNPELGNWVRLYVPLALIIVAVTVAVAFSLVRSDIANLESEQRDQLKLAHEITSSALLLPVHQIRGMLREPAVKQALKLPSDVARPALQEQLKSLLYRNDPYDHARYLSKEGKELVSMRQSDEVPVATPVDELRDDSKREWFKGIIAQPPGDIYVSTLDLSLDGDVPDVPIKPVIRFGIRLPEEGASDAAVLVVNLRVDELLERLRAIRRMVPGESILMLNPQGYWLLTPQTNDAFSFALGDADNSFAKRQPDEWARISAQPSGQMLVGSGIWTWRSVDPATVLGNGSIAAEQWKLVTHVPAGTVGAIVWRSCWPVLFIALITLGILGFGIRKYRKLWHLREASKAERALSADKEKLERRLRLATEGADLGVWHWDMAGEKIELSPQCRTHLAIGQDEEATLERFFESVHPDDREPTRRKLDEAAQTRKDYAAEYRIVNADGSLRWIAAPGRVYSKPDGSLEGMSGVTIDVTKLKETEATLRELAANLEKKIEERTADAVMEHATAESQRRRIATVINSLPDPHVMLHPSKDENGKIDDFIYADVNAAACRYHKSNRSQMVGASILETMPGLESGDLLERLCETQETSKPLVVDDFHYRDEAAGIERWFDLRAVKVGDDLSLSVRDVTDRHTAMTEIAESQRMFRLLAENASDVVLETDNRGIIRWISPTANAQLGHDSSKLIGSPFKNMLYPDEWDAVDTLEQQVLKGTPSSMEVRVRTGLNGYQSFSLSLRPLFADEGTIRGIAASLRDIQKEVQSRESLKAERLRLKTTLDSLIDPHTLMQPVRDESGQISDFIQTDVNPAACNWIGIERDHLLGRSLRELLPAVESTGLMKSFVEAVETGRPLSIDEFAMPVGGKMRWLDVRAVRADKRLSCIWRDVTESHLAVEKIAASEERYRLLATNSSDIILLLDPEEKVAWVSPSLKGALGFDAGDWLGRKAVDLLADKSAKEQFKSDRKLLQAGESITRRLRLLAKDATHHWVEVHAGPHRDANGEITGVVASFRVIDAEVQGEQERQHQQDVIASERKHLADVIKGSDTGTWEWHVQTGALTINEVWARLIGYRLEELLPASLGTWEKFTHPEDLAHAKAMLERCFRRETEVYEAEARMRHRDGEWVWILTRGRVVEWTDDGKPLRMLGIHRDITANMNLRQQLEHQARTDALTGLSNRREFEASAQRELTRSQRTKSNMSFLMMDIDRFKSINDEHGHDAGDEVLKTLARTCVEQLREVDILARLGGEEFAVLLPDTGLEGARLVAERLREALGAASVDLPDGKGIRFTVSIGAAEHAGHEKLKTVWKRADEALYRAKNNGRNCVCTG